MTMLADPPAPAEAPARITVREYFSAQNDLYTKTDAKRIGPELERRARERGWHVVPEWTGLWWRRK